MRRLDAFDLFAGCGGLSLGMEAAGIAVRWANELDIAAQETYRASHPNTCLFTCDANELLQRLLDRDKSLPGPGDVDLVAGGPPCQGFSGFNRHRRRDDPRNSLVETFLGFVEFLKPRYVLMENVPGMLSLAGGATPRLLLAALEELGYSSRLGVLQAGSYGLPQNRWRVFIWAAKGVAKLPEFPEPTHLFPRMPLYGLGEFRGNVIRNPSGDETLFWHPHNHVTVSDAIGDLPEIESGGGFDEMPYKSSAIGTPYQKMLRGSQEVLLDHRAAGLGKLMLERCKHVPAGGGWLDLPERLKPRNLLRHGDRRYENRFGRLAWSGVFNTILSRAYPYWGAVFHPVQDRIISVRESARAQGFPDTVRFCGSSLYDRYRQVGNAVPPPLAQAIATMLVESVSDTGGRRRRAASKTCV